MTPVASRAFGAQSMTAPLREVLVKAPGAAFGRAFDDPAHGFLRPVDLDLARRQHDGLVSTLDRLGVRVRVLDTETDDDPDLVYVFDPLLIADGGAIPLRPGKPNRAGEPAVLERMDARRGHPDARPDRGAGHASRAATRSGFARTCCASGGRCARTTPARASSRSIVGGDVRVFDVPYWKGPAELVHLLSVISPVADDVAVVFLPLLPAGLYALLADLGVRLVEVPEDGVRRRSAATCSPSGPGSWSSPRATTGRGARLEAAGCEVHAIPLGEVGENGSGGVTCLTRPILRG